MLSQTYVAPPVPSDGLYAIVVQQPHGSEVLLVCAEDSVSAPNHLLTLPMHPACTVAAPYITSPRDEVEGHVLQAVIKIPID